ncbi:MAG: hypothetical protein K2G67_05170 [Muribaculaceae bacterium]|nr:hypothetical protein [Muribaculaceae bacterium]
MIIIRLSGREISLYLSKDKGAGAPLPFPAAKWPMKLESFGGEEASAPLFKIGKKVDELFHKVIEEELPVWCDSHSKEELPIILLLENDLDETAKSTVVSELHRWGFENVHVSRSDTALFDYLNQEYDYEGLVAASSDGRNLFISLYSAEKPEIIERKIFPDAANDNRVEAVAAKIWEQVSDCTLDLDLETEIATLRKEAEDFLSSGKSEKEGDVRLSDGDVYPYFLNRHMLKELGGDQVSLDRLFTEFMLDYGMHDRSRMAIVLRTHAIGNFYIKENLVKSFNKVYEETDSMLNEVQKRLVALNLNKISENVNPLLIKKKEKDIPKHEQVSDEQAENHKGKPNIDNDSYTDSEEIRKADKQSADSHLIPVELSATIKKEKAGLFKKKSVLTINVDFPETNKLKWASVLCVQEKPLKSVESENIVKEFDRGDKGPFTIKVDLPLSRCPDARKLRIYFKPSPDEPVGINNAYLCEPCVVNVE